MRFSEKNCDSLKRLPKLTHLGCELAKADENLIARFKELSNLKDLGLYLPHARLSEREWAVLAALPMRSLGVSNAVGVNRFFLGQLEDNKHLTTLWLHGSDIADDMLAELARCKGLAVLQLTVTGIGDAGLEHLKSCPSLRYLEVGRSKVTEAGVR
jgi:hypothetical protein